MQFNIHSMYYRDAPANKFIILSYLNQPNSKLNERYTCDASFEM